MFSRVVERVGVIFVHGIGERCQFSIWTAGDAMLAILEPVKR
jgi:hypothetical protein